MEELEISAPTVDEAVDEALEQLGLAREEVEITVLSEGRSGILGMGAQAARVRVRPLSARPMAESEIGDRAKAILEELLRLMGVTDAEVAYANPLVEDEEAEITPVTFDVKTEDSGILIGRRGQTLAFLQYVVNLIIAHQVKAWVPIIIDVEGYKKRHYESLRELALRIAEQVKLKGQPFTLEPMPAYERRIIHLTLANNPDVITKSVDEAGERKVVVLPKEQ